MTVILILVTLLVIGGCKKNVQVPDTQLKVTASYSESQFGDGKITFQIKITNGSTYKIDFGDGYDQGIVSISDSSGGNYEYYHENGSYAAKITAYNSNHDSATCDLNVIIKDICWIACDVNINGSTEFYSSVGCKSTNNNGNIGVTGDMWNINDSFGYSAVISISIPPCKAGDTFNNNQFSIIYDDYSRSQFGQALSSNGRSITLHISEKTSNTIKGTFSGTVANGSYVAVITNGEFYAGY